MAFKLLAQSGSPMLRRAALRCVRAVTRARASLSDRKSRVPDSSTVLPGTNLSDSGFGVVSVWMKRLRLASCTHGLRWTRVTAARSMGVAPMREAVFQGRVQKRLSVFILGSLGTVRGFAK